MPKENEEWTKLQRDRGVYQKIYDELLQKLENARVSKDTELTDKTESLRVVDPAVLPVFPAKPNMIMLILMGIGLGIAGGVSLVIWLESINHTFKDDDTLEAVLKLPVLASIQNNGITETEAAAIKARDTKIFIASAGYLCVILLVLVNEMLIRLGSNSDPFLKKRVQRTKRPFRVLRTASKAKNNLATYYGVHK